jgi:glycosyltransferase involved in cell wall biosynthesis
MLAVSRIEPEKGLDVLVDAFNRIKTDQKLVIAGYTHYETGYNRQLINRMKHNDRIILSGFVTGEP